jgi:tetratricopeptide (TPR) repeat protein
LNRWLVERISVACLLRYFPAEMDLSSSEASGRRLPFFSNPLQLVSSLLAVVAVMYGFLAGFHTLQDFDLGWQLATGRWVAQHHWVFSTDVFSYTASGNPWIYPALSGLIFYFTFQVGGYALLSWMGAFASAGTVALLLRRNSIAVSAMAVLAAPLIANRTQPRAEMFTTILFAAFLSLLWRYYRTGRASLWLLPVLMIFWVNLHPGFVAGLALCAGYVLLEALDLPFPEKRDAALARLRRTWPWLAGTLVATVVNPWGPYIYLTLARQQQAQAVHSAWIVEWASVRPSWASVQQALDWRGPQSGFWWLMVAVAVGFCYAIWRKQWGTAILLAASTYFAMQHVRLQALFACVAVVVGGSLIGELAGEIWKMLPARSSSSRIRSEIAAACFLIIMLITLAGTRCADLVSNHYYMRSTQLSVFGAGLSWWYPERAMNFIEREKLPANLFNGYTLGGHLTWRLFPAYRDYIDSRALPFGSELFFRGYDLATEPPTSEAWRREADARNINTIIVPLARYQGMTVFPPLHAFCRSSLWRPVYLDEVSAVFVRASPENNAWINRLQIDCDKMPFESATVNNPSRGRVQQFNFWANAGGVLYSLERYPEALAALDRAQAISSENATVHLFRALVFQQLGRASEAEQEFRTSLSLEPNEEAWFDFGLFYMTQKRYSEAADIFRRSAENSSRPHELWMMLGQAYVQGRQPQPALEAFNKAADTSPFPQGDESLGSSFNALIAAGRANAWYQLGDLSQAVSFQEEAVKLSPEDPALWRGLADVYEVQGRTTKAAEARLRATSLGAVH